MAHNCRAEFQASCHAEGMLKINWDLRQLWKTGWGLGKSPKKLCCFCCIYSDNLSNTKKVFSKQQGNLVFVLNAYKFKAN